ncbi:hypothetical protein CCR75_005524 [Bremia lactucae]|uniref:RxLR effector protein n=1 Tax=Bremia lactucae TaxID=4779 RepID=A0A976IBT3_BRELC|nr:hypothetical protein CCR75_005524 [Bremia lactucae]
MIGHFKKGLFVAAAVAVALATSVEGYTGAASYEAKRMLRQQTQAIAEESVADDECGSLEMAEIDDPECGSLEMAEEDNDNKDNNDNTNENKNNYSSGNNGNNGNFWTPPDNGNNGNSGNYWTPPDGKKNLHTGQEGTPSGQDTKGNTVIQTDDTVSNEAETIDAECGSLDMAEEDNGNEGGNQKSKNPSTESNLNGGGNAGEKQESNKDEKKDGNTNTKEENKESNNGDKNTLQQDIGGDEAGKAGPYGDGVEPECGSLDMAEDNDECDSLEMAEVGQEGKSDAVFTGSKSNLSFSPYQGEVNVGTVSPPP